MDARKEDAKCLGKPEGLAGLFVWLKKVGLPIHLPGLPGAKKISPPLALMTPEALTEGEAKQVMAEIKAAMEKQLGQPVTLIDLGLVDVSQINLGAVKFAPCKCKICQMRANVPFFVFPKQPAARRGPGPGPARRRPWTTPPPPARAFFLQNPST
jgi:hypothetical protein